MVAGSGMAAAGLGTADWGAEPRRWSVVLAPRLALTASRHDRSSERALGAASSRRRRLDGVAGGVTSNASRAAASAVSSRCHGINAVAGSRSRPRNGETPHEMARGGRCAREQPRQADGDQNEQRALW